MKEAEGIVTFGIVNAHLSGDARNQMESPRYS
jgi:hypothetical protein